MFAHFGIKGMIKIIVKPLLIGFLKLMKVTDHIKNAKGNTQFSFEILPPLKGQHIQSIFDNIDRLNEFKPPFIDVTYHREEYNYKDFR